MREDQPRGSTKRARRGRTVTEVARRAISVGVPQTSALRVTRVHGLPRS